MKLKLIPILLCLALLAACLTGCGSEPAKVEITESPAPTQAPTQTTAPTEAPQETPEATPDPEEEARKARYQAAYEKYAPDQPVLRIGDELITWSEYFSWIYDIANQMESNYQITDWNETRAELSGIVADATFGSYVRKIALNYVVQVAVINQKAKELGVTLSEAQQSELQDTMDGYVARVGGEEAFDTLLAEHYISKDYFREQNEAMILINNIFTRLYGEDGAELPEEDAIAYLKDNDYLYAKHILFRTVDDSRQPISEEEAAKKKAEAEEVLERLRACPAEDLPALFDSLMQQYSEDTGLLAYPDGYYFQAGEMVPAFEETVRSLEENGLSDLVETDYGYHIIFCPAMSAEHVMGYDNNNAPYRIKAFVSAVLFDKVANEWYAAATENAQYEKAFEVLDFNELFKTE